MLNDIFKHDTPFAKNRGPVSRSGMKLKELAGRRIAAARKAAKLSQIELADRLNVGQSTVSEWEKGGNEPDLITFDKLGVILSEEPCYLAFGVRLGIPGETVSEVDVRAGAGPGGWTPNEENTVHGGNQIAEDPIIGRWQFPPGYVSRELRLKLSDVRIVEVRGDSMEPMIRAGDRVMVDASQKTPSPPGIFALWDGLATVIKRLEFIANSDPPTVEIISDNTLHQRYRRTIEEAHIIGRVVWFARRL